jgi:RNA polymerase nonessential primary-like sigma factor
MSKLINQATKTNTTFSSDIVRTYLRDIGRIPLLTHEQEIVYGKQVQKMMKLLDAKKVLENKLNRELSLEEWAADVFLSENEVQKTIEQGKHAKERMIAANLRLVVTIAKKYQKRNVEFLDLIQEGSIGLERCVEKFDPQFGYKFSTYAFWWIRQGITRAISQQSRTIRLPIHICEKLNQIKKVQRELAQKLGHSPSINEIAKELQLEPFQIRDYLKMASSPVSLDIQIGENEDTQLLEILEDKASSPEQHIIQESLRQELKKMLRELTPQQQTVVVLRFGLEDGQEMSLAKVGAKLNLSRERIRQLERDALTLMRRRFQKIAKMEDYVAS